MLDDMPAATRRSCFFTIATLGLKKMATPEALAQVAEILEAGRQVVVAVVGDEQRVQ